MQQIKYAKCRRNSIKVAVMVIFAWSFTSIIENNCVDYEVLTKFCHACNHWKYRKTLLNMMNGM